MKMAKRTTICAGIDTGTGYGQYLPRISLRSSGLRALRFREQLPGRHCEPTGRANARPMTGSAKQSSFLSESDKKEEWIASSQALLAMTL